MRISYWSSDVCSSDLLRRELPPDPKQARILNEAIHHGLRIGFTVPVSVPGEPAGCCTFATGASELPPAELCRAAAWIADEAFAEARRLHGYPVPIDETVILVDPDRVDPTNVPRLVDATSWDAMAWLVDKRRPEWVRKLGRRLATKKVDLSRRVIRRANRKARVESHFSVMEIGGAHV